MQPNVYTDEELLNALRSGGIPRRRAWEFMYKNWRNYWLGLIVKRGGTPEEAEDAHGTAAMPFERTVIKGDFHLQYSLRTYLVKCVLNAWYKSKGLQPIEPEELEEKHIKETAEGADKLMHSAELSTALDQLLARLSVRCRLILQLFGLDYSMEEIAEKMGFSNPGKAKKEKYECQSKLKEFLRNDPDFRNRLNDLWHD